VEEHPVRRWGRLLISQAPLEDANHIFLECQFVQFPGDADVPLALRQPSPSSVCGSTGTPSSSGQQRPAAPSCVERAVMRLVFDALGFRTTKIWPEAAWLRCLTDTRWCPLYPPPCFPPCKTPHETILGVAIYSSTKIENKFRQKKIENKIFEYTSLPGGFVQQLWGNH
jgi:hypothetical protein